jgi:hypothetical protein
MNYTHNLNILLFDDEDNSIKDDIFLNEIKNILCKNNTIVCEWNGKKENIIIKWDRKELNNIDKYFMGDLFASPIYEMDSLILKHIQTIISNIKSKYNIKFHLSRIIRDKHICKDSVGTV